MKIENIYPGHADGKICSACGQHKPAPAFSPHRRGDGFRYLAAACKDCMAERAASRRLKTGRTVYHYEAERRSKLKRLYGMTPEDYDDLLEEQNGCCAICGTDDPGGKWRAEITYFTVDHCHDTGKVRGLLCVKCNRGLGLFNDNPERLESSAAYLRRHAESQ